MVKVIKNFKIDLSSMAAAGAARQFSIIGDNGAIFSLEVKNELNEYYKEIDITYYVAEEIKKFNLIKKIQKNKERKPYLKDIFIDKFMTH